jgi:hypothetical protein
MRQFSVSELQYKLQLVFKTISFLFFINFGIPFISAFKGLGLGATDSILNVNAEQVSEFQLHYKPRLADIDNNVIDTYLKFLKLRKELIEAAHDDYNLGLAEPNADLDAIQQAFFKNIDRVDLKVLQYLYLNREFFLLDDLMQLRRAQNLKFCPEG